MKTFAEYYNANSKTSIKRFKQEVSDFVLSRYFGGILQGTPVPRFVAVGNDVVVIGYAADSPRCVVVDDSQTSDGIPKNWLWTCYEGTPKAVTEAIKAEKTLGEIEESCCDGSEGHTGTPDYVMGLLMHTAPSAPKCVVNDADYDL